ncbi:hypothetical protein PVAND_014441 [Polypedilum vanderplanki]|nr:hypothetical protein PVAND_014441 [Polypedilum vanderplanki]
MAARSSIICEMIEKNPNLNGISLTNVTDEVIEEILDYFYDDIMPKFANLNDALMLYDLAMKMNLQDVILKARKEIVKMIKKEKSVEVLELALKYKDSDLMSIAFEVVKETFPKMKFKANLLNDEVKIRKLIKELKNYWKNIDDTISRFSDMNFFENELDEFNESEKITNLK